MTQEAKKRRMERRRKNPLSDKRISSQTGKEILYLGFYQFTHKSYLLEGKKDAKSIGAGELVQVAGPIGAVLELIRRIGTIFLPITQKA